ncbi:hypothetical protein I552_9980 [Mycobacterium xenopi 3993]|nr:hypothetical protein I552_9980 [Mycobacterium xenopi 3993]
MLLRITEFRVAVVVKPLVDRCARDGSVRAGHHRRRFVSVG